MKDDCANCYSRKLSKRRQPGRIHFLLVLMIVGDIVFPKRECILWNNTRLLTNTFIHSD